MITEPDRVSILVFVELALGGVLVSRTGSHKRVSILVFVELALGDVIHSRY